MADPMDIPRPSAPAAEAPKLKMFLGAYEAAKAEWVEQQKQLSRNPNVTDEEKMNLMHAQAGVLTQMLDFFGIEDEGGYVVPAAWENHNNHPRLEKITSIFMYQTSKNGHIKPFLKGSDVDFGIWKDQTINMLRIAAVDDEGFEILDKLCMSATYVFIPRHSEAYEYLRKALLKRTDENGKLRKELLVTDLLDEIWRAMKNSEVNKANQILAKVPQWRHGNDTVIKFNKRFNDYLTVRLGVQVVGAYLDSNPALRREHLLVYKDCIPARVEREVKIELRGKENVSWDEYLHACAEAETALIAADRKEKIKNRQHNSFPNYDKKSFPKGNRYKEKKRFTNKRFVPNKGSSNKFSDNKTHNTNPQKSGFSRNIPSNASTFKKEFNKQKPINNNSNTNGNFNRTKNGMNSGNKPAVYGGGRRFDNKPGNRGPQVNMIDELSTSLCQKFQDMMLTAKMSTLIAICLIMLFIPGVSGQLVAPPGYTIEPCNAPRTPNFYRLSEEYIDKIPLILVSLTPIKDDCQPDMEKKIKDGFEFGDWFVTLEEDNPIPAEYKYLKRNEHFCNYQNIATLSDNIRYGRTTSGSKEATDALALLIGHVREIRAYFLQECPDWDKPTVAPAVSNPDQVAPSSNKRKQLETVKFSDKIDAFQLPEWKPDKLISGTRNKAEVYRDNLEEVFNKLKSYAFGLEKNTAKLTDTNSRLHDQIEELNKKYSTCEASRQSLERTAKDTITLSEELKKANEKMNTMILRSEHDTTLDHVNTQLRLKDSEVIALDNQVKSLQTKLATANEQVTSIKAELEKKTTEVTVCKTEIDGKNQELLVLQDQVMDTSDSAADADALAKCRELLHTAVETTAQVEKDLHATCTSAKQELNSKINDLTAQNSIHRLTFTRVKYNTEHIRNEIEAIRHKPDGIACIVKKAMTERLNTITTFMSVNILLAYTQPEEVQTFEKLNKYVAASKHQSTYNDITRGLGNIVKDIDLNQTTNDYESLLTFLGGVITTIVGRIVKDKIGDYIVQRKHNRESTDSSSHPNSYGGTGIPLIEAPARRITTNPERGLRVNRHGIIGGQVNVIQTPEQPRIIHRDWLPFVDITLNGIRYDALLDTGATINVISEEVIATANGDLVSTSGRITCRPVILDKEYTIHFDIVPGCHHDIILGMPAINTVGIKKLFCDRLLDNIDKPQNLFVAENTVIPPQACTIFHARISPGIPDDSTVILDLNSYWKRADHLLTMEQVCKPFKGIVPVVLVNAGRNPVRLTKDTHIGQVRTIQEIDPNTLVVTSEEVIPEDADWEDALPPYPQDPQEIDEDSFYELIDLSDSALSSKDRAKLLNILWKHRRAFHEYDGQPGLYTGTQRLNIKLKTKDVPRRIKPSRMSYEKESEVSKQIADMLRTGMIEPSRSPYLSRVVLVRKKDQKWRFVVDFRGINSLIEQQSHIIPRIDRITGDAAGKRFYTSFDLKAGFHQIPLDENSRKIAAFITHEGVFQYKVMPMGLTGSPDKFQEIMDEVLAGIPNCYVYLDDILTCANDETIHLNNIEAILQRIEQFGMKITLNKCQFGRSTAQYLGFVLDNNGIHPNPDKVKAISEKPIPRNQKEVKSFLGAASYFRRHIKNFSAIADPLYKLDKAFEWTESHTIAFNKLKDALINATTLSPPDNTKNYTIFTDASFQGLGAALVQNDKPIAFASRSLKPAEKNYPIIKLEALGLVYALKQFRPYIYGKHTVVVTDHKPLLALLKNKELTGILQRYQMAIMEYDLTIQYIKGEANNVADYLSRESFMAIDVKDTLLEDTFPTTGFPPYKIERFQDFYDDSEKLRTFENGKIRTPSGVRIYVPQMIREKLLQVFHEHPLIGNHLGFDKISGKFKAIFYWPSMDKLMTDVWKSCQICQFNKEQPSRLVETHLKNIQRPKTAWHTLNADFLHVDSEYVFVMVDEYSKFVVATVCKKQNGPTLKNMLMKCFTTLGFPEVLRSDNGPAFISRIVTEYLKSVGVTQQFSSPHNHKSNAFVERFNRTLR
uniref:RNA-directed DNA polymerase n=1 Tax=Strongyloides papillosus TaxID=174720 RepID=A0A0N5BBX0_STREA